MINILLCGANGKMGQAVRRCINSREDAVVAAGIDKNTEECGFPIYSEVSLAKGQFDCIIDFSNPAVTDALLDYAKNRKIPAVICTTGLSKDQISKIEFYSREIPIFYSANMSIGVNLITELVQKAAKVLGGSFDIEIVEKHHNQKLDAPSGTALAIADAASKALSYVPHYVYDRHSVRKKRDASEIGIHSVRGGNIVGEHSVIFAGTDEVVEIKHTATSKEVFAVGAVRAALFLCGKEKGLYNMGDLIREY